MITRERIAQWWAQANRAADDALWSDAFEWWQDNATSLIIVFVFVCGLGSCVFYTGKAALTPAAETEQPDQPAHRNPWALDPAQKSASPAQR